MKHIINAAVASRISWGHFSPPKCFAAQRTGNREIPWSPAQSRGSFCCHHAFLIFYLVGFEGGPQGAGGQQQEKEEDAPMGCEPFSKFVFSSREKS